MDYYPNAQAARRLINNADSVKASDNDGWLTLTLVYPDKVYELTVIDRDGHGLDYSLKLK
jgi:hypothetical protein